MPYLTYENWKIEENNSDPEISQIFSSLAKVADSEGELIVKDNISEVIRFSGMNTKYYIKRYTGSGRKLFDVFRPSRIASESKNLLSLNDIGIPVPRIVAYGEKRNKGRFMVGALITEEVKNSSNLAQYLSSQCDVTNNKKWLYSVIDQLAKHVSTMHASHFIHRDLNLRNVLVTSHENPGVFLIDCPAGGFRRSYLLKRGIIRDLAHLDKVARYCLSARDLLRFYKQYKHIKKLTKSDKKMIYNIRHFHDKHRARQNRTTGKAYRTL